MHSSVLSYAEACNNAGYATARLILYAACDKLQRGFSMLALSDQRNYVYLKAGSTVFTSYYQVHQLSYACLFWCLSHACCAHRSCFLMTNDVPVMVTGL